MFENDVKIYGIQTMKSGLKQMETVWEWCKDIWYSNTITPISFSFSVWEWCKDIWYSNSQQANVGSVVFENDVKIYGIQTVWLQCAVSYGFENDVKIYGIQTDTPDSATPACLRMM